MPKKLKLRYSVMVMIVRVIQMQPQICHFHIICSIVRICFSLVVKSTPIECTYYTTACLHTHTQNELKENGINKRRNEKFVFV